MCIVKYRINKGNGAHHVPMEDEAGGPVRDKYRTDLELDRASKREREGERLLAGWLLFCRM